MPRLQADGALQKVTVCLWTDQYHQAEQWVGNLPPVPELVESYRIWKSTYRALCCRLILRCLLEETFEDELEIESYSTNQKSDRFKGDRGG